MKFNKGTFMCFLVDIACWPLVFSETWQHGPQFYFLIISRCFDGFDGFVKKVLT